MNAKELVTALKDIYFARFGSPTVIDWKIHPKNLKNLIEKINRPFSAIFRLKKPDKNQKIATNINLSMI